MDDTALEYLLLPRECKESRYPVPNWSFIHSELSRSGVTLELLHEEYAESNPCGHYGYTWFCNSYKEFAKKLNPSMRQIHLAGDKVFIDFSGKKIPIANPYTGAITYAELFVGVLGASGYPFVIALPSQKREDFIHAHILMFEAFGGVPKLLVPDNVKSAVTNAHRYDPDLNRDYQQLASYYGTAIMPTRPYKPKDKGKVENGVKLTQRWILARLRDETFYSVSEINSAIAKLLTRYREKKIQRLDKSRGELFESIDKPALLPLPSKRYIYRAFKLLKVSIDYHIQLEFCFYSVPYQLIHKRVEVWYDTQSVSIYFEGKCVSTHPRLYHKGSYSTHKEHMSSSHKKHLEWSPGKIMNWGLTIGSNTAKLLQTIMERKPHPEMGYRTCLGIMRAFKNIQEGGMKIEDLEHIATYAIATHHYRFKEIERLLKNPPPKEDDEQSLLSTHENIRGGDYYK